MEKEALELLIDLHLRNKRQGPGSDVVFGRALELSGIDTKAPLQIADIGCGTGAASIALAQNTKASIVAVDFAPAFLGELEKRAEQASVKDRIETITTDMSKLSFKEEQLDVIWAEGAIYNIGFERGIAEWKKYLKPGGVLVATEITWLRSDIPKELASYWQAAYPEIDTASKKLQQLEQNGYTPIGYFVLPSDCWLKEYYEPLRDGFNGFLERNKNSDQAKAIIKDEEQEIALYEKYKEYYSYGCYIAQKL